MRDDQSCILTWLDKNASRSELWGKRLGDITPRIRLKCSFNSGPCATDLGPPSATGMNDALIVAGVIFFACFSHQLRLIFACRASEMIFLEHFVKSFLLFYYLLFIYCLFVYRLFSRTVRNWKELFPEAVH